MRTSDDISLLAVDLIKVKSELLNIKGATKNSMFKSTYVALPDFMNAVTPILTANNFALIQSPIASDDRVGCKSMLLHTSGQFIETDGVFAKVELSFNRDGRPTNSYGQAAGSLITYCRRYDGFALLGIAEADNDGQVERADHEPVQVQAAPPAPSEIPTPPLELFPARDVSIFRKRLQDSQGDETRFCRYFGYGRLEELPLSLYAQADELLQRKESAVNQAPRPAQELIEKMRRGS